MNSETNNVASVPKGQYAITAGCSTLVIWVINNILPPKLTPILIDISPILGSIIAYFVSLAIAQWGYTPEEIKIRRKLETDKKSLEKLLDDAKKYPHRYEESYINQLKQELQETNLELTRVGRKSLEQNNTDK
jgi:hypothetical protein